MKTEKTNAVRLLEQHKQQYMLYSYPSPNALSGMEIAQRLGADHRIVFKTLVTVGKSGGHYVFMIPAEKELNLKKAAQCTGEKSIDMIRQKELLPLTGYIHGGCSPIGMKKQFPTFIDKSAADYPSIIYSGGKIGLQVETQLDVLETLVNAKLGELT